MRHLISAAAGLTVAATISTQALAAGVGAIHIVQSRGEVVQASQRIGSVLIADPAIANVQPLSENTLFLVGKATGATELYILDQDQNLIERRPVFVTRSLADMRQTLPAVIQEVAAQD